VIVNACGVNKCIDSSIILECSEPQERYKNLILNMLYASGLKGIPYFIGSSTSPEIGIAITGLSSKGRPCIIINEDEFELCTPWELESILSHEFGHISRRHLDDTFRVTRKIELEADYYAGFWNKKNFCPSLDTVLQPFSKMNADVEHPPYSERKASITTGWADADKNPFNIPPKKDQQGELGDVLKDKFDFILLSTPTIKKGFLRKPTLWHKVTLHIISSNPYITNDSLFSKIDYVSYALHPFTFADPLPTIKNDDRKGNGDNFQYNLTVWGTFPITSILTFTDGSAASLTKTIYIPEEGVHSK